MVIELNQENKQIVWNFWRHLEAANGDELLQVANESLDSNLTWHGPDPINELHGVQSFVVDFWLPLQKSFRDLKRQTHIFFGGQSNGRIDGKNDGNMWVTGTGYLNGIFVENYLSIPASNSEVNIRWGDSSGRCKHRPRYVYPWRSNAQRSGIRLCRCPSNRPHRLAARGRGMPLRTMRETPGRA